MILLLIIYCFFIPSTKNELVFDANYFFNKLGQVKLPLTAMHAVVSSLTNVATMQLFPLFRKTGRVSQT